MEPEYLQHIYFININMPLMLDPLPSHKKCFISWKTSLNKLFLLIQFSSVTQSCPTLCNSMDCNTPVLPVRHQLLEFIKLMSMELMMPSNHLILCCPLLLPPSIFPSIRVFSNESVLHISIGVSASASVLPMNIQDWFPLGWTSWISLQSKGLTRVFSNTTVQRH